MDIILWIVLGALAGWIASMIMGTNAQQGALSNIVIGIIGAVAGGFIMNFFNQSGVTGFNVYSILVAVIGAAVLLYAMRMMKRVA